MGAISAAEVVRLLAQALHAEPSSIAAERRLDQLDGWDSMGVVTFLGDCADRWSVEVAADDAMACTTVSELTTLVLTSAR